jgi:hypothetical protein
MEKRVKCWCWTGNCYVCRPEINNRPTPSFLTNGRKAKFGYAVPDNIALGEN